MTITENRLVKPVLCFMPALREICDWLFATAALPGM